MKPGCLVVFVLALVVLTLGPGAPAGDEDGSSATVILKKARPPDGHDVWEARFVLLTPSHRPADGLDLRIRHVLGGEKSDAGAGRFFTVLSEPDPETLITNLGKLGTLEILDRANIPLSETREARYAKGCKIPVAQVETRSQDGKQSSFVRTKFEEIGTKVRLTEVKGCLLAQIEASILLAIAGPHGQPVIAGAEWQIGLDVPVGRTAVLRSHYRLPGALLSHDAGGQAGSRPPAKVPGLPEHVKVRDPDVGRVLIVLLTHSRLP